jgi:hypothetical protein
MTMRYAILAILATSALGAGCVPYEVSGTAYYASPDLVTVSPGVEVVADYDYPVFYSNNAYWRYEGGVWYRSRWHDRGWIHAGVVPGGIARIDHPWGYAHYRAGGPYVRGGYARGYMRPTPRASYRPRSFDHRHR